MNWCRLTVFVYVDTDAPKQTFVTLSSANIREGQDVTLTCSAKGRPEPTFVWFKQKTGENRSELATGPSYRILSIRESHAENYICEARNYLGNSKSPPKYINVTCESNHFCTYFDSLIWYWKKMVSLIYSTLPVLNFYKYVTSNCFRFTAGGNTEQIKFFRG